MEIRAWAEQILAGTTLADKLLAPDILTDTTPGGVIVPDQPGRPPELAMMRAARSVFPSVLALPRSRGLVLHHFANHELLALELMALALLKFPSAPAGFRRAVVTTLRDEQRHLSLYLGRMHELGVTFGELPLSAFFWDSLAKMSDPREYLAGMSLTFEQGNLDHAAHYIDVFNREGDAATAALLSNVHDDEIAHVRVGAGWMVRMGAEGANLWDLHLAHLPWPLTPQRAKGKTFHSQSRTAAGLDRNYIEELRVYSHSKGRTPDAYWFNSDCELELAGGPGYTPPQTIRALMTDLETLPMFLAAADDIVFVRTAPRREFLAELAEAGFKLPEFVSYGDAAAPSLREVGERRIANFRPWGLTPRIMGSAWSQSPHEELYFKPNILPIRAKFRASLGPSADLLGEPSLDGVIVSSEAEALAYGAAIRAQWDRPVVLKAPFGASGQNAIRLSSPPLPQELGWLRNTLARHGAVLAETWLERTHDVSAQLRLDLGRTDPVVAVTRFFTDQRGHYRGHVLGKAFHSLTVDSRTELFYRTAPGISLADLMTRAATFVADELSARNFVGPASLDMFTFRHPKTGVSCLRAIGEINPRFTMGHVSLAVAATIVPEPSGHFLLVPKRVFDTIGPWPGAICLTDPERARSVIAVVATGPLPPALSNSVET